MIDKGQFAEYIIRPALQPLDLYSAAVERLLLVTASQESKLGTYIHQIGGPALGVFQMEPATHNDIWDNFIAYNQRIKTQLADFVGYHNEADRMIYDMQYATIMARLQYRRYPEPIPAVDDQNGMWNLYKLRYNTPKGKATRAQFNEAWERVVDA